MNIKIERSLYTPQLIRDNPEEIYVFGDNMKRYGKRGQACIRDEPNAYGIATKRYPSMEDWAFFNDRVDELECVKNDLRGLYKLYKSHTIVFPAAGIGTGLARMEEKSPEIWKYVCRILKAHFGYLNGGERE